MSKKECISCKKPIDVGVRFCPFCGARQPEFTDVPGPQEEAYLEESRKETETDGQGSSQEGNPEEGRTERTSLPREAPSERPVVPEESLVSGGGPVQEAEPSERPEQKAASDRWPRLHMAHPDRGGDKETDPFRKEDPEKQPSFLEHIGKKKVAVAMAVLVGLLLIIMVGKLLTEDQRPSVQVPPGTGEVSVVIEDLSDSDGPALAQEDEDIARVMEAYYDAFDRKDVEAARALLDELPQADESAILDDSYENYRVKKICIRDGMSEDARLVLVTYTYQCAGIDTPIPAYSCLYVKQDGEGNWKVSSHAATDEGIRAYMNTLREDAEILAVIEQVRDEYEGTMKENPRLLELIGDTSFSPALVNAGEGEKLRARTNVNVRATADTMGEVLGALEEGEVITKEGREGDWIIIDYQGRPAYVFGEFFEIAD